MAGEAGQNTPAPLSRRRAPAILARWEGQVRYIIDGHNLIGALPDLSLADPDDEAKLVQRLRGFAARTGRGCTVIFDHGLPGGRSALSNRSVQVVFASMRSSADRVLRERIKKLPEPRAWTVVSSDAEVLGFARRRQAQSLRSSQFAALLERPQSVAPDPGEDPHAQSSPEEVEEWLAAFAAGRSGD